MATTYMHLLPDAEVARDIAHRLITRGYYPVPVGLGRDGKGWIIPSHGTPVEKPVDGAAPDPDYVLRWFDQHPGAGVSVAVPHLRDDPTFLCALDVDTDDADTLHIVALIINSVCPVKVGRRGATFFTRRTKPLSPAEILSSRGLASRKGISASKIGIPRFTQGTRKVGIDLLDNRHTLLPPTLHYEAQRKYEWVPFPGTDIALNLEDVPAADLPVITDRHILLLVEWATAPQTALWKYFGQTGQGDHHDLMVQAVLYMWHQKFTEEEILEICSEEAARSAPDDESFRGRLAEIKNAIKGAKDKFAEQKPVEPKEAKVAIDRVMLDFLLSRFTPADCALFGTTFAHWNGARWQRVTSMSHMDRWAPIKRLLLEEFPTVPLKHLSTVTKEFVVMFREREVQPDPHIIPFRNGILHVPSGTFNEEQKSDNILYRVPHEYDPTASDCPIYDTFISDLMLPPEEYSALESYASDHTKSIQTLEEFIGYCLARSYAFRHALFLVGATTTGKSTLGHLIRDLLPAEWVANVPMNHLAEPNFLAQMVDAHVNFMTEGGRQTRDVDDIVLRITSGEEAAVKILYRDVVTVRLAARLLYQGNLPPQTFDSTGAFAKRAIILRTTDRTLDDSQIIPNLHRTMLPEAPAILNRWARAYGRLLARGRFDPPEYSRNVSRQLTVEANSATAWVDACCDEAPEGQGTESTSLYGEYSEWCERFGYERAKLSVTRWGHMLTASGYPSTVKWVGGKAVRIRKLLIKSNFFDKKGAGY